MKRQSHPLLLLISLLVLAALACSALNTDTGVTTNPSVDEDAIVQAAVSTVQAQLPAGDTTAPTTPIDTTNNIQIDSTLQDSLIGLYNLVNPSVVFIITFQDQFALGSGSGFIYDNDGNIVTNNHVVADGDSYEVVFFNGERARADLIGTDVDSDLAVIRADFMPNSSTPIALGDSKNVQVGQLAVAIGNPFGEQNSMSLGIVSGLGRTLESQRIAEGGGTYSLPQVVQTDAPINPGNSGGPLVNLDGQVIGVNSAIQSTTGFNSGVGFSIPVNAVHRIVPALIANGSYTYPFIGISSPGTPLTLDLVETLGLPQTTGVYVTGVQPSTPADEAGLVPANNGNGPGGDLIIAVDGNEVREFNDLITFLVFETEVGQTIQLTIIRDGETIEVPLTLGARP